MPEFPFTGPSFKVGQKIRITKKSLWVFRNRLAEVGLESSSPLTVKSTRIAEIDNSHDGMPYTERFSFQRVEVDEFPGSFAADHAEGVDQNKTDIE